MTERSLFHSTMVRAMNGVLHDLRNQLNTILCHAEMLKNGTGDENRRQHSIERIFCKAIEASRFTQLANSLVHGSGGFPELVDLHDILRVVAEIAPAAFGRKLEIEMKLASPRASIQGNSSELQLLFLHVLFDLLHGDPLQEYGRIMIATRIIGGADESRNAEASHIAIAFVAGDDQGDPFPAPGFSMAEGSGAPEAVRDILDRCGGCLLPISSAPVPDSRVFVFQVPEHTASSILGQALKAPDPETA